MTSEPSAAGTAGFHGVGGTPPGGWWKGPPLPGGLCGGWPSPRNTNIHNRIVHPTIHGRYRNRNFPDGLPNGGARGVSGRVPGMEMTRCGERRAFWPKIPVVWDILGAGAQDTTRWREWGEGKERYNINAAAWVLINSNRLSITPPIPRPIPPSLEHLPTIKLFLTKLLVDLVVAVAQPLAQFLAAAHVGRIR